MANLRNVATETCSYFGEMAKRYPDVRKAKYYPGRPSERRLDTSSPLTDSKTDSKADAKKSTPEVKSEIKTEVKVVNGDTFDTAMNMAGSGLNPLVLNMASYFVAGGGWRKGSRAQEEELFRRSTYAMSLEQPVMRKYYPLLGNTCIYSPSVVVFRAGPGQHYALYDWSDCCSLACIAMPAIRQPVLTKSERLTEEDARLTLEKIRTIFAVAAHNGHDSLVLGALGCGAYGNPPDHIAELFNVVVKEYSGQFKQVVFAILTDHNDKYGNLAAFRKVFE